MTMLSAAAAVERLLLQLGQFLSPVHTSNIVEATFDFVERTKFQRKTRSTLLPFWATKSNVASTLLLVWTGHYTRRCRG